MVWAESVFSGQIKKLPVIGKPHEQGVTFEKLIEDVRDYVMLEFTEGDNLSLLLEKQVDDFEKGADITKPSISNKDMERQDKMYIFQKEYERYAKREHNYKKNKTKLYTVLYGQCTPTLLTGVKSHLNFTKRDGEKDVVWITKAIKKLSVGIDKNGNELITAHDALRKFFLMYQVLGKDV